MDPDRGDQILAIANPDIVGILSAQRQRNNAIIEQWNEFVRLTPLENDRDELAAASLENLRDLMESLLTRKLSAVTESHGTRADHEEAGRLWRQFSEIFEDENSVIRECRQQINSYKYTLDESTAEGVSSDLDDLRLRKLRHSPEVEDLITRTRAAETDLQTAEKDKKEARDQLNATMQRTLSKFKDSINAHLADFNAEFRITELGHNYRGKSPRVEYQIQLRGESIELNNGRPTFATALSEGDKKTMGFAFFAASTLADPDIAKKIVVIDDPMSSLDSPRREHTIQVVADIAAAADQVVLMAHDEHFLRSARACISSLSNPPQTAEIHLRMAEKRYSDFAQLDLDYLCQSEYLAHYKLVSGVAAGTVNDPAEVAQGAVALRLLLEGYLHRKFPGAIPAGRMLGDAIKTIEKAAGTDSPCAEMASRAVELRQLSTYANRFHHNTNPDYDAARRESHQAIVKNAEKILDFIHSA